MTEQSGELGARTDDVTEVVDLEVADEAADEVAGGMAKQELVTQVAPKTQLAARDAAK